MLQQFWEDAFQFAQSQVLQPKKPWPDHWRDHFGLEELQKKSRPKPHPKALGWTGKSTVIQTLSPNFRTWWTFSQFYEKLATKHGRKDRQWSPGFTELAGLRHFSIPTGSVIANTKKPLKVCSYQESSPSEQFLSRSPQNRLVWRHLTLDFSNALVAKWKNISWKQVPESCGKSETRGEEAVIAPH